MRSIKVYKDPPELCSAAANIFIEMASESVSQKGRFVVALSGGTTPNMMYDVLSKKENAERVEWEKVFIFWGDERYVSPDHADNNSFQARKHLLNNVPIPDQNIFAVPVTGDPAADAAHYEHTIRAIYRDEPPAFDLVFLGMGEEAHTASIFPGSALLTEAHALVREVYVEVKQMQRISFTPVLINAAEQVIFMICGSSKAAAFKQVIQGEYDPGQYPAQIVQPLYGHTLWMVDEAVISQ